MERTQVSSSNIRAIGYDPSSSTLEIEFNNGAAYQYTGVPQWEVDGLMNAESHGKYLNANIKNRYPFVKL